MGLLQWIRQLFTREPGAPRRASPFPPGTGPARLIVLRHAEKTGDKRDPHLSPAGRRRAEHLVGYLPQTFGQIDFLIAARTSGKSRRPVETLEPLAASLGAEIWAKIDDDDGDDLVDALAVKPRYQGKVGVISWRHSELPDLLAMLGAPPGAYPRSWDETDYTTVVEITYPSDGSVLARPVEMPRDVGNPAPGAPGPLA
jgi:hypothetical protein